MTRRGHNEGSIYQRSDGRWCAFLTVGYDGGKQRRKYVYGATKRAVQQKLARLQQAQQQGLPVIGERQTVGQYLAWWLEEVVSRTVRPKTSVSYEQLIRVHVLPALGTVVLQRLQPQQLQTFLNDLTERGLAPRTVQYVHAVLRSALNKAVRWELVSRNVATLVTPPRRARPEVQPLSLDDATTFLAAVADDRLGPLYTVALALGLRLGEALGLRWEDIDLDAATLTVRRTVQRVKGALLFSEPKSARSRRTVALPETAVSVLREHQRRQGQERRLAGSRWVEQGLVFPSTIGTPLEPRNALRHFHDRLAKAGLPRKRFHDLRHTAATLLLAQGVSPRVIMETLGHSQISLTMDTYSHVLLDGQRDAAARMDDILRRLTGHDRTPETGRATQHDDPPPTPSA